MDLRLKRILAFMLDYLLIMLYALVLFAAVVYLGWDSSVGKLSLLQQQMVSFGLLTLPVYLYFALSEFYAGKTIGKRLLSLRVIAPRKSNIICRNIWKFLPWEVAHFAVYQMSDPHSNDTPVWVWCCAIIPQLVVAAYLITLIVNKGKATLYDTWANTEVVDAKLSFASRK